MVQCVNRSAGERHSLTEGAADVNDAAAFTQMPRGFLCRDEQATHIDGNQLLKILQRKLLNRREGDEARVVHENINAPESPDGFRNRQTHRFCVGGIRFDRQRFSARRFNRANDFIGLRRGAL